MECRNIKYQFFKDDFFAIFKVRKSTISLKLLFQNLENQIRRYDMIFHK